MRNMKVNKKAVVAMIIGLFLLSSTIIINANNADPVCFDIPDEYFEVDDGVTIVSKDVCFDPANEHYSLYLLGYIYDEEGNSLGYVNISGGFWREPDGRYYVYGSACSDTVSDVDGWAYASGELAGRGEVVDGPNWNNYASAWDAFTTDDFPNGTGNGLAEITVDCVTYSISIDGTI